jgi:hypothetical protein
VSLKESMAAVFYRQGGYRNAHKALMYLGKWLIACESEGYDLDVSAYSEWWSQSRAKSYREREALTACLPVGVTFDQVFMGLKLSARLRKAAREGVPAVVGEFYSVGLSTVVEGWA